MAKDKHPNQYRERAQKRKEKEEVLLEKKRKEEKILSALKDKKREKELPITNYYDLKNLSNFFIRDEKDFVPKSRNEDRNYYDKVKYLLLKYNIPNFLKKEWLKENPNQEFLLWSILVGQGKSLHKEKKLPFLTRAEISYFLNIKLDVSPTQAIWLAKANSIGVDFKTTLFLCSRFPTYRLEDFHVSLLRFFAKHPVDRDVLVELVDYVVNKYREDKNYSLKGRTLQSLTDASNEWHKEMLLKKGDDSDWLFIDVDEWKYYEKETYITWICKQLTSSKELFQEGKELHHCVGSYDRYCKKGQSAIFSMRGGSKITIEITLPKLNIVQARKRYNEPLNGSEKNIVSKWYNYLLKNVRRIK